MKLFKDILSKRIRQIRLTAPVLGYNYHLQLNFLLRTLKNLEIDVFYYNILSESIHSDNIKTLVYFQMRTSKMTFDDRNSSSQLGSVCCNEGTCC